MFWKPIPDLPFWWNPPSTKYLPYDKLPRISRFRYFRGKKGKINTKNSKFWKIFFRKMANFGHFFLQNFPGSSPVLAWFLPGSCPVLPGSRLDSSFFWDFSICLVFSSVFDWDQRKPQKIRNFRSEGEKSAKLRNFRAECERSQSCTNFSGLGQQNPENSCL